LWVVSIFNVACLVSGTVLWVVSIFKVDVRVLMMKPCKTLVMNTLEIWKIYTGFKKRKK
jgi:hypothetical protein